MMYIMAKKLSSKVDEESPYSLKGHYIKAVPLEEEGQINEPEIGKKFYCCRLFTSPVERCVRVRNGWLVETENSNYIFMVAEIEDIKKMAEQEGMAPYLDRSVVYPKKGTYYWMVSALEN